jgi:hypothetical protein
MTTRVPASMQGLTPTGGDDTALIQTALNSGTAVVDLGAQVFRVDGTLTVPPGVTLAGLSAASEYYPSAPGSGVTGAALVKPASTGAAGPIVILQSGSGLRGMYLKHLKTGGATTGIVQIGLNASTSVYNAHVTDVRLYGHLMNELTGLTTCVGIFFPDGLVAGTIQRYFNRFSNFAITNCDRAIQLGENCNANVFTGFVTRQCYEHVYLDGNGVGGGVVENIFSGFNCSNIGALVGPAVTTVFKLQQYADFNTFTGYATECNGAAFSIDSTCLYNQFHGAENEINLSVVPAGNTHSAWAPPVNRDQVQRMLIPTAAAPLNYTAGAGNLMRFTRVISGTLPTLDGGTTLVAAATHSKVFARFPVNSYTKALKPTLKCRLTVAMNAPGGSVGDGVVAVEFWYRPTDNVSGDAQLSVISVEKRPAANYINSLKFITGVAGAGGFGLAVIGGNVGAVTATRLLVDLEILAFTHSTNSVIMADMTGIVWGASAATANDVTNAIELLTVADTAV